MTRTLPSNPCDPTSVLALLEEKRRAVRREALEYLAEADRLDALYAAVTGTTAGSSPPDVHPDPHGGPN